METLEEYLHRRLVEHFRELLHEEKAITEEGVGLPLEIEEE